MKCHSAIKWDGVLIHAKQKKRDTKGFMGPFTLESQNHSERKQITVF